MKHEIRLIILIIILITMKKKENKKIIFNYLINEGLQNG